ncbi:MAG TPA: hypothetical protein VHS79_05405, partial [Actinomycetes bacterium]|nr:hypothetical protein [Actinomycetes bacterium]
AERQIARAVRSGTSATAARVRLRPRGRSWRLRVGVTASPEARPDIEQRARAAIQRLGGPQDAPVRVRIAKARRVN